MIISAEIAAGDAEKRRVALISVFAAVAITAAKGVVGALTNSLAILAEAAHSALDLAATLITFVAVRAAAHPADADHHYGHAKIESFAALIQILLLIATCGWIVWEASGRLRSGADGVRVTVWSFGVMLFSIAVDYWRSRALSRAARKYKSQALEADALHFGTDMLSSGVVIVGLIGARLGFPAADPVAALAVALIVAAVCGRLLRRVYDSLIDRSPHDLERGIKRIVEAQPGIRSCRSLRVRESGGSSFCDMVVGLDRRLPFEAAHTLLDDLEDRIRVRYPGCDLRIHAEPERVPEESVVDQARLALTAIGCAPHNIELFQVEDGRLLIDLHLEAGRESGFMEAHAQAVEAEAALRAALPRVDRVAVHLEQERYGVTFYRQVDAEEAELADRIRALVAADKGFSGYREVLVFERAGRLKLFCAVYLDGDLPLAEVHRRVTALEDAARAVCARIDRVVVQAVPAERRN